MPTYTVNRTLQLLSANPLPGDSYSPVEHDPLAYWRLSEVAQNITQQLHIDQKQLRQAAPLPEIIGLRLLDYLTSKKGYIRRKGPSLRRVDFYLDMLPDFVDAIRRGRPITMSVLCLCPALASYKHAGPSPYPHMGAYLGFENLQRIAAGVARFYQPGVRFVLGYEGNMYKSVYFYNQTVLDESLAILHRLNEAAYRRVGGSYADNPIRIVDMRWMVARAFGGLEQFERQVAEYMPQVNKEDTAAWVEWYEQTVDMHFFSTAAMRRRFAEEKAAWRAAVQHFKYAGGLTGKGFMRYDEAVIPITVSGRRPNMLALQMVPNSSYLPHHRIVVYEPGVDSWRMMSYQDLSKGDAVYEPRYVEPYAYPFYYQKVS